MTASPIHALPSSPPVRTIWCPLPGRTVSAAALVHGVLWLIVDPEKVEAAGDAVRSFVTLLGLV